MEFVTFYWFHPDYLLLFCTKYFRYQLTYKSLNRRVWR